MDCGFEQKLRTAIERRDVKIVRRIIKGGVDVNSTFWYEGNLLHESVVSGNLEIVNLLLQAGAKINHANKNGDTALHMACRRNNLELVKLLLEKKANVNARTLSEKMPLHVALWQENAAVAKTLLKFGADVNHPDNDDWSPLHWSARSFVLADVTEELLDLGAIVNCQDKSGMTPLHVAYVYGKMEAVKLLLKSGADTSLQPKNLSLLQLKYFKGRDLANMIKLVTKCGLQLPLNQYKYINTGINQLCRNCNEKALSSQCSEAGKSTVNKDLQAKTVDRPLMCCINCIKDTFGYVNTLSKCTRTVIRKTLNSCHGGRAITKYVKRLPLPQVMQDYLIFSEEIASYSSQNSST